MSNPYQLVVFDWEGTVSDTLGQFIHVVADVAKTMGYGDIDPNLARKYVDLGLNQAIKKVFPHLSMSQQEQFILSVQNEMVSRPHEVWLMPGVKEFIQKLHAANIDLAVATNKGQHSLQRALHTTGLADLFKVTRSAGQVPPKPCPQMLEEIIDEYGQNIATTLMIGDSVSDMEMATSIQVTAIGVDFYHQQEVNLITAGAIAVFDDYGLLADYLGLPKE